MSFNLSRHCRLYRNTWNSTVWLKMIIVALWESHLQGLKALVDRAHGFNNREANTHWQFLTCTSPELSKWKLTLEYLQLLLVTVENTVILRSRWLGDVTGLEAQIDTRHISSGEGVRSSDRRAVVTLASRVIETSPSGVSSWTRELSKVTQWADFQTCTDHEQVVRNHFPYTYVHAYCIS